MRPPRPYYGWTITWALALTTTVSYGVLYYAYGVFLPAMEHDLSWTRAQTSGAFSAALLVSGLVAPLVGRVVDRHGARVLMTLGSLAGTLLVLAWSRVTTLPGLYTTWVGLGVVMACVFYDPAFTVIARWFQQKRPQALLTVTLVAGLASTIFVPLSTALLSSLGWRVALTLLAGLLAVLTVLPHALFLRRDPQDLGLHPDGAHAPTATPSTVARLSARVVVREARFRWLTLTFALAQFTAVAVAVHLVPLLLERGYAPTFVALAAGLVGLAALPGRVVFAPLTARLSLPRVTTLVFAARVLALLALLILPGTGGVWAFVLLFGAANGMTTLVRASLIAEVYGSAHYGAISGSVALVVSAAQATAPFVAGGAHVLTGGYTSVLWGLLGMALLALIAARRLDLQGAM